MACSNNAVKSFSSGLLKPPGTVRLSGRCLPSKRFSVVGNPAWWFLFRHPAGILLAFVKTVNLINERITFCCFGEIDPFTHFFNTARNGGPRRVKGTFTMCLQWYWQWWFARPAVPKSYSALCLFNCFTQNAACRSGSAGPQIIECWGEGVQQWGKIVHCSKLKKKISVIKNKKCSGITICKTFINPYHLLLLRVYFFTIKSGINSTNW